MSTRQIILIGSVLLTACALVEGNEDPNAGQPSDPNVDHEEVSISNAMHFAGCALALPDCLNESGLLGFWSCPLDQGYDLAVGADGRVELLNHDGDHGIGCVACDGTFELVSDEYNLGKAWVNVEGKLSANGAGLNVSWRECGALDIEACRANPGAARSQTCVGSD